MKKQHQTAWTEVEIYRDEKRKLGFRFHFVAFLFGIAANWLIWYLYPTDHIWPIWPTLGWSIGIAAHNLSINLNSLLRKRVEKRVKDRLNRRNEPSKR
ncbi:MAG: 2TM domain-containing protein [Leptolyngbya sp. SIO3F4]|nr:2TM domain-containing protein [Leptolyngbya sp. SIO3F4]